MSILAKNNNLFTVLLHNAHNNTDTDSSDVFHSTANHYITNPFTPKVTIVPGGKSLMILHLHLQDLDRTKERTIVGIERLKYDPGSENLKNFVKGMFSYDKSNKSFTLI